MELVERPLDGDDVRIWAEPGGPIMLRAVASYGDPVELNETEARAIADVLLRLAKRIESE